MLRRWMLEKMEERARRRERWAALDEKIHRWEHWLEKLQNQASLTEAQRDEAQREIDRLQAEVMAEIGARRGFWAAFLRAVFSPSMRLGGQRLRSADPPGMALSRFLKRVFGQKYATRVFDPLLADMQHEFAEAVARGEGPTALALIRLRGYWAVLGATKLIWLLTLAYKIYRAFRV